MYTFDAALAQALPVRESQDRGGTRELQGDLAAVGQHRHRPVGSRAAMVSTATSEHGSAQHESASVIHSPGRSASKRTRTAACGGSGWCGHGVDGVVASVGRRISVIEELRPRQNELWW